MALQVGSVSPTSEGEREISIHSRPGRSGRERRAAEWSRHASGTPRPPGGPASARGPGRRLAPAGAEPIDRRRPLRAPRRHRPAIRPRLPGPERRLAGRRGALRRGLPRARAGARRRSALRSTRPCSTPPSTPASSVPSPAARAPCGCPSPGATSRVHAPGASELRVKVSLTARARRSAWRPSTPRGSRWRGSAPWSPARSLPRPCRAPLRRRPAGDRLDRGDARQ